MRLMIHLLVYYSQNLIRDFYTYADVKIKNMPINRIDKNHDFFLNKKNQIF